MTRRIDEHPSYEGKKGRHPANCDCSTCSKKRPAPENPPASETPAPQNPPASETPAPQTPPATPKPVAPEPSNMADIANEGEVKDNAHPVDKKGMVTREEKVDKKGKKTVTVKLPGKLFKFIGNRLASITKIESYRLTDEEADDIAALFADTAESHGWKVSGDWGLIFVCIIWLALPTLEFMMKNKDMFKGWKLPWQKKEEAKQQPPNPQTPTG